MADEPVTSNSTATEVAQLIRQATTAARVGDREAARNGFRQATKLDPRNTAALLGLAGVVGTLTEKRQLFERVLELEPDNLEAKEGLEAVSRRFSSRDAEPLASAGNGGQSEATAAQPASQEGVEFCYRHPNRETGLHCMQCTRPICGQCAMLSPVGQLCPECRKDRRMPNYKVKPLDLVKGFVAAAIAGGIGAFISGLIGIFFLIFFLGAAIGEGIMRIIEYATNKRGPLMQIAAALGILTGAAIYVVPKLQRARAALDNIPPEVAEQIGGNLLQQAGIDPASLIIFLVLAIGITTARLR